MNKELLSWCFRCHRKFQEMGEVLKWGKHYPACRVKHIDGTEENLPESMEIIEAICKDCMVEVNRKRFDTRSFIKKEPVSDSTLTGEHTLKTVEDGTTNEEVLKVLIDRMNFLQAKAPCRENAIVITKLEECLMWLEKRTAGRVERGVEGTNAQ